MKTFGKMLKIEGKLSIRDMNMIIFAIVMPLIVLVILGVVQKDIEQSFGAVCSIAICASGLMGLPIMISDYRERKILKRFWTTPISPSMILFVHLTIYVIYAAVSLITLLITAKIFWKIDIKGSFLVFLFGWLLVMCSIYSIGILVGGVAKNSKIASIIASALYFPMLIFSGATLPYEVMPKAMQKIVDVMPLTQGIKILKAVTMGEELNNIMVPIIVMMVIMILCVSTAIKFFHWE